MPDWNHVWLLNTHTGFPVSELHLPDWKPLVLQSWMSTSCSGLSGLWKQAFGSTLQCWHRTKSGLTSLPSSPGTAFPVSSALSQHLKLYTYNTSGLKVVYSADATVGDLPSPFSKSFLFSLLFLLYTLKSVCKLSRKTNLKISLSCWLWLWTRNMWCS